MSETVVFLHGFAGTARHWDRVTALIDRERYSPLALELTQASPLSLSGAIQMVAAAAPERFILCGYSMGGRVALNVASSLPGRVSAVVLISTTAGIEDAAARRAADEQLAAEIEQGNVEEFIARWRRTPLFAQDPDWVEELVAQDTRRLTPTQLAATLRAYSAGLLPSLWDRLETLDIPTVVLAGERDAKYVAIAHRLEAALPQARCEIVLAAGHRVALEAPQAVAGALAEAHGDWDRDGAPADGKGRGGTLE